MITEKHGPSFAPSNQGARQRSPPPRKRTTMKTKIVRAARATEKETRDKPLRRLSQNGTPLGLLLRNSPAHLRRRRTNFAEVCAASFFFSSSGALSLVSLHTSSLLAYLYNNVHDFGRNKRTAVQHLPNQGNTKKPHTTQSPPKKGQQAHQPHQAPHAHAHKVQAHNQTSPHASPRGPLKTSYHNSPSLSLD